MEYSTKIFILSFFPLAYGSNYETLVSSILATCIYIYIYYIRTVHVPVRTDHAFKISIGRLNKIYGECHG